jgi:hypothetical protein
MKGEDGIHETPSSRLTFYGRETNSTPLCRIDGRQGSGRTRDYSITTDIDGNSRIAQDSPCRDDCSSLARPSIRVEPDRPL